MTIFFLFILWSSLCFQVVPGDQLSVVTPKHTVKVINLDIRKKKWKMIRKQWSKYFTLERVSATPYVHNPVCGLALTHISLMKEFLTDDQSDLLLIMEDDAMPTPEFNMTFFREVIDHAIQQPQWEVINFGPWFTNQPVVHKIDDYLVEINYFHTTHFIGYHRRVEKYLDTYSEMIRKGLCTAVDNYFGNYGLVKSGAHILAPSKLMAIQNHQNKSDIGGAPEMNICAINAALAGRYVVVEIVGAESRNIAPTFKPPVFGYKVLGANETLYIWSHQCNLEFDEVDVRNVDLPPPLHGVVGGGDL
jgi:hypothetical protein